MNYYDREEWKAFLSAIRASPDDNLPRLVVADWLDENGEPERAAWVRHHVRGDRLPAIFLDSSPSLEWLPAITGYVRSDWADAVEYTPTGTHTDADVARVKFSRGFVSRVSAPLSVLHGGECSRCRGGGRYDPSGARVRSLPCSACSGTGRTLGVLAELLRREPLTAAVVEVTGCDPLDNEGVGTYFGEQAGPADSWYWLRQSGRRRVGWELPDDVYDALEDSSFASESTARLALGEALCRIHSRKSEVLT